MTSLSNSTTGANPGPDIPYIDMQETEANQHVQSFIHRNLPVILQHAGVEEWRAYKEWRTKTGGVDFEHLSSTFGSVTAPVTNCKSGHCLQFTVDDFLSAWQTAHASATPPPPRYMKDWHLVRDFPDYHPYSTPVPFETDWLNDWWTNPLGRETWANENNQEHTPNDYRFCYMGCKGTWTGLHHDVMCSFSWSSNVIGRKLWRLFPPSETHKLYHTRFKHQLVEDTREGMYDTRDFPNVGSAIYMDVVQEEAQVMFVPSGWHHQVHNLDDCISINHNWLNGCCIQLVWGYVKGRWDATKGVIDHLENGMEPAEFHECCSQIMHSDIGLSPEEFVAMCLFWEQRLQAEVESKDMDSIQTNDGSMERLASVIEECYSIWPCLRRKDYYT